MSDSIPLNTDEAMIVDAAKCSWSMRIDPGDGKQQQV
jgi:hypothetical protein